MNKRQRKKRIRTGFKKYCLWTPEELDRLWMASVKESDQTYEERKAKRNAYFARRKNSKKLYAD